MKPRLHGDSNVSAYTAGTVAVNDLEQSIAILPSYCNFTIQS